MRFLNRLFAISIVFFSVATVASETRIAVAANFISPMKEITAHFEQATGHKVHLSFGSSGKLFAQIRNGAPFDAFLSADTSKPDALEASGDAVSGSRFTYSLGRLILWTAQEGDAKTILQSGEYFKLAIANPRLAPYGAAAIEVLDQMADDYQSKLVMGENITQAYQYVASGNATLGLLALAQIIDNGEIPEGSWLVPAKLHTPIRQDAVLLQRGKSNTATQMLLEYLQSEPAIAIIQRYGYQTETP